MRLSTTFSLFSLVFIIACTGQNIPDKAMQIGSAILAAPEDQREGATVMGYDTNGKLLTIKEGTNNTICVADNPNQNGFSVACYHKDLEPFMARGRVLKAEGKNASEIFDMRENEVKAGKLTMPDQPTTLHVLSGKEAQYFAENDSIAGANYRYVVYIPYATGESTGLPTKPVVPGGPWLMDPGTHRAHIMISTPRK